MVRMMLILVICILTLFVSCLGQIRGSSLLHWAAQEGHIDVLNDLFANENLRLNQLNEEGETPLLLALQNKKFKTAKLLIDQKASLDFVDPRGWNYLHWAAFNGSLELTRKFIKNPELANGINKDKNAPLHLALQREHKDIAKILLNLDVDAGCSQKNKQGNSPLHLACEKGYRDIVPLIISKKVDLDLKNNRGYYPIQLAAEANHKDIVQLLMKAGADVSVVWPARDFLDMIF